MSVSQEESPTAQDLQEELQRRQRIRPIVEKAWQRISEIKDEYNEELSKVHNKFGFKLQRVAEMLERHDILFEVIPGPTWKSYPQDIEILEEDLTEGYRDALDAAATKEELKTLLDAVQLALDEM